MTLPVMVSLQGMDSFSALEVPETASPTHYNLLTTTVMCNYNTAVFPQLGARKLLSTTKNSFVPLIA